MFIFRDPIVLVALLALPAYLYLLFSKKAAPAFRFSSSQLVAGIRPTFRQQLSKTLPLFRTLIIALIFLALARPQSVLEGSKTISEGVDIVLAIDTSTSMLAEDFRVAARRVNRFDVVREVVKEFISKRKDDRIGMIAFAARAYTVCPLTTDYAWLNENLDRVRVGMIEDATAIGSAIASSCNRLRTSKTKSKVIILIRCIYKSRCQVLACLAVGSVCYLR